MAGARPRWKKVAGWTLPALALVTLPPGLLALGTWYGQRTANADASTLCDAVAIGATLSDAQRVAGLQGKQLLREGGGPTYEYRARAPVSEIATCDIAIDGQGVVVSRTFAPVGPARR